MKPFVDLHYILKTANMKTRNKLLFSTAAMLFTGLMVYAIRTNNTRRRRAQVANEGYETAPDILHPEKSRRFKKLHYGPVLPHHEF